MPAVWDLTSSHPPFLPTHEWKQVICPQINSSFHLEAALSLRTATFMAFRFSVQLVLLRSIRSLETLWAPWWRCRGCGKPGYACPRVKPQASRLLNPCENPPPSADKPKPLRNLLHDLSDQQTADLTPISILDIPVATPSLLWLSPKGFLTEVKPPPQHSVLSEKPLCLSSCQFHSNL